MNRKTSDKAKRLLSGMIATALTASLLPAIPAAAEETEVYPYTMFAASDKEGAITVNADYFFVNGNIATNGTIISSGNMNVYGERIEKADEDMIYILERSMTDIFRATM